MSHEKESQEPQALVEKESRESQALAMGRRYSFDPKLPPRPAPEYSEVPPIDPDTATSYIISEAQFAAAPRSIKVPKLVLSKDPAEHPQDALLFFRQLWHDNGYSRIPTPHHDTIAMPPRGHNLGFVLVNSYRGLTDGQVVDRQYFLDDYKVRQAELDTIRTSEARLAHKQKLARILEHLPDINGLQGIERYLLIPIVSTGRTMRYRLGTGSLQVIKDYMLQAEAELYDLPTRKTGVAWNVYPYREQTGPKLVIDAERYPEKPLNRAAAREWQAKLRLLVPLLRQRALG
jgi:hypothetical protein